MNAFYLLGVAALLMLSACSSGSRESRVQYTKVSTVSQSASISVKPSALDASPQRYKSEEKLMACGQVLSFWAGHLR
jgi:hypothetical protein